MADLNTTMIYPGDVTHDVLAMENGSLTDTYQADTAVPERIIAMTASSDDTTAVTLTVTRFTSTDVQGSTVILTASPIPTLANGGFLDVLPLLPWARQDAQGNNYMPLAKGDKITVACDAIASGKYVKVDVDATPYKLGSYT